MPRKKFDLHFSRLDKRTYTNTYIHEYGNGIHERDGQTEGQT